MQILENIAIVLLTIFVLLAGGYLLLVLLGWGLKMKSGSSEQDGLMDLWTTSQAEALKATSKNEDPDNEVPDEKTSEGES